MRKIRRRRNKQRKIIVISLTCFLFIMVGGYAAFQTNLNITAKGNIAQKSRVIQSWTNTDNTDFHSDYYKENIVSATFLDNNDIPSNAVESWNVSEDKEHGGVMAWVVQNNTEKLNKLLSDKTGQSIETIERDTERDHWMTAEEALKYGLIDGIMDKRK